MAVENQTKGVSRSKQKRRRRPMYVERHIHKNHEGKRVFLFHFIFTRSWGSNRIPAMRGPIYSSTAVVYGRTKQKQKQNSRERWADPPLQAVTPSADPEKPWTRALHSGTASCWAQARPMLPRRVPVAVLWCCRVAHGFR